MNDRLILLLVDDDKDVLRGVSKRFDSAGFDILLAYDGDECLACASEHQPDAIVLDVRMPRKDGLSTLAELQCEETTKGIPVVMLSASLSDQRAALEAGARFFLGKPYSGSMLIDAVRTAIAERAKDKDAGASAEDLSLPVLPTSNRSVQSAETTSAN